MLRRRVGLQHEAVLLFACGERPLSESHLSRDAAISNITTVL